MFTSDHSTLQHILITINDNNPRNINITLSGITFEIWAMFYRKSNLANHLDDGSKGERNIQLNLIYFKTYLSVDTSPLCCTQLQIQTIYSQTQLNDFIKMYFLQCFLQRHVSALVMSHLQVDCFS